MLTLSEKPVESKGRTYHQRLTRNIPYLARMVKIRSLMMKSIGNISNHWSRSSEKHWKASTLMN